MVVLGHRMDVIICLGHVFDSEETVRLMHFRARKAVKLFKEGRAKHIIFTGGFKSRQDLSEASYMAQLARSVPRRAVLLEEQANTTVGNALYSKRIMEHKGWRSAIIVTSPEHLRRAQYIFERLMPGYTLQFVASRTDLPAHRRVFHWVRELRNLWYLRIFGVNTRRA